jgi:hypothetical protein
MCCRWSVWCALDTMMHRLGWTPSWLCDRHDLEITRFYIHCGDETCTEDHG